MDTGLLCRKQSGIKFHRKSVGFNLHMDIKKDHIAYTTAQDLNEFCQPLKTYFGITYFSYRRLFNDGSIFDLGTNPAAYQYYFDAKVYEYNSFEYHPNSYQDGFILLSQIASLNKLNKTLKDRFNIDYIICLIIKAKDAVEFFFFATKADNHKILQFYLNDKDTLVSFANYFKQKASSILAKGEEYKIFIPSMLSARNIDPILNFKNEHTNKKFKYEMEKKLFLPKKEPGKLKLSQREIDCAKLLMQGMSGREISEKLAISQRTVETHLIHLKDKLSCRKKSELVSKLLQNGFGIEIT